MVVLSKIYERLHHTAGNLYFNNKPAGYIAVLQPFGGSLAQGTNDKAGGEFNLIRWISPRIITETFLPAKDYRCVYMINS